MKFRIFTTILASTTLVFGAGPSFAQTATASVELSQQDVARRVLEKSLKQKQINLESQTEEYTYSLAQKVYDYTLTAEGGSDVSKLESLSSTTSIERQDTLSTRVNLSKLFSSGTTTSLEYARNSYKTTALTGVNSNQTQDLMSFTFEQKLWNNFFGSSSRAELSAAEFKLQSAELTRIDNLQNLVLESIRTYWKTYVSQELFQESLASRDRTQKLATAVKRKSGFGYSSPGELSQAMAELSAREQDVKTQSASYLAASDELNSLLLLPEGTEVKFKVPEEVPPLPALSERKIEELRPVKASGLRVKANSELLDSAKSKDHPELNLVGKLYSQGLEDTPESSYSEMTSGNRNRYYFGLKFVYNFGSNAQEEEVLYRKLNFEIEKTKQEKLLNDMGNRQQDIQRRAKAAYAAVMAAKEQKSYREKAVQELNRSYTQGRTDISVLISAMGSLSSAQINYSKAVGDYFIALNEWAAFRDELIPASNTKSTQGGNL